MKICRSNCFALKRKMCTPEKSDVPNRHTFLGCAICPHLLLEKWKTVDSEESFSSLHINLSMTYGTKYSRMDQVKFVEDTH